LVKSQHQGDDLRFQKIYKIGGKCLIDVKSFKLIKKKLCKEHADLVIVSALGSTTAMLKQAHVCAAKGGAYQELLEKVFNLHSNLASQLLDDSQIFINEISEDLSTLSDMLAVVSRQSRYDTQLEDKILAYGEFWSCALFSQYWSDESQVIDASKILTVDKTVHQINVDWQSSQKALKQCLEQNKSKKWVITGYIARNKNQQLVTLGFEGSDFSASIFGCLLSVNSINIWTDVDGIYTADPNKVARAHIIKTLSYHEAFELAYFGASIIHPQTIQPARQSNIPIRISNALKENSEGSLISNQPEQVNTPVRGLTSFENVSLINIEGTGTMAIVDMTPKIFEILSLAQIPVLLISQASSEQSICFVVRQTQLELAMEALELGLTQLKNRHHIHSLQFKKDRAILAVVGDQMVGQPGISAGLLQCLAKANINIDALSQGASERNISVVIDQRSILKALNLIHDGFYLSKKRLQIILMGLGNVGKVLLKQLFENKSRLEETMGLSLEIIGLLNSKKMLLNEIPLTPDKCEDALLQKGNPLDYKSLFNTINQNDTAHTVLIDATASEVVSDHYLEFIYHQCHIVTPNKKMQSGSLLRLNKVRQACKKSRRHMLYETNVCAGLPVIKTLKDLIATGDEILSIQGVFSGTLSYLFNAISEGQLFSEALDFAHRSGLTEPDPRDDLNGMDVARKCICLARELGFECELTDVSIAPILPDTLFECSLDDFLENHKTMDKAFANFRKRLKETGHKLIYSGKVGCDGSIKLQIEEINQESPFFNLKGTDNMVIFHTKRYQDYPLVIQGPGAGAEVTAAGVFADILRLAEMTLND
jgi:aspartokinase/homoserine dehydrogenase 1